MQARAMGTHYRRYESGQPFLPPPSPCDWLPENLAYFIADTLDQIKGPSRVRIG